MSVVKFPPSFLEPVSGKFFTLPTLFAKVLGLDYCEMPIVFVIANQVISSG